MKVTIYIPDNKRDLYEKAKATLPDSLSALFVKAIEAELGKAELGIHPGAPIPEQILKELQAIHECLKPKVHRIDT